MRLWLRLSFRRRGAAGDSVVTESQVVYICHRLLFSHVRLRPRPRQSPAPAPAPVLATVLGSAPSDCVPPKHCQLRLVLLNRERIIEASVTMRSQCS